eukprot:SAG31_NODE_1117_length_9817_cov_6.416650_4_plen_167_part_00
MYGTNRESVTMYTATEGEADAKLLLREEAIASLVDGVASRSVSSSEAVSCTEELTQLTALLAEKERQLAFQAGIAATKAGDGCTEDIGGGWVAVCVPSLAGVQYYWRRTTNEVRWERPQVEVEIVSAAIRWAWQQLSLRLIAKSRALPVHLDAAPDATRSTGTWSW